MMKTENYIRWFLFAFVSLFLVACKPTAKFEYSPTAPNVGEVVKFDATQSTVYKAKEGNAISIYAWDFGDGSKGTGAKIEHTYATAGNYTVTLKVVDLAGQINSTAKKIIVKQGDAQVQNIAVSVQTVDGVSIPNATVTVQGQTVMTDLDGLATLKITLPQDIKQVVAKFEKSGFISQSMVYELTNLKAISATLLAVKQTIPITDISVAQVIESKNLGAKITIPANAFVKADGSVATGSAVVEFTPWDITQSDLNAMLANGLARDVQGNLTNLISAGMISATFKDVNGQVLQLATGQTADIQMDLPLSSINNQEMTVGTQIQMWHFDEAQGLWIEEGLGQVIVSHKSSTGLAVQATVSHFSTWNWDLKFENAGSIFVQCQSNGVNIPCNVIAKVRLNDGSILTKSNYIEAGGITVINMPSSGNIEWTAKDLTGTLIGSVSSGTSGTVIIDLGNPTTDNFIRCTLPNGTAVACFGKMNDQLTFSVSQDGGYWVTGVQDSDGQLDWVAQTQLIFENNQWVRYKGTFTSDLTGNVNIILTDREVVFTAGENVSVPVVCTSSIDGSDTVDPNGNWEVNPELIGKPCKIIFEYTVYDGSSDSTILEFDSVYGKPIIVSIPVKYFVEKPQNSEYGRVFKGHIFINDFIDYSGYHYFSEDVIPDSNQVIPLFLYLPS